MKTCEWTNFSEQDACIKTFYMFNEEIAYRMFCVESIETKKELQNKDFPIVAKHDYPTDKISDPVSAIEIVNRTIALLNQVNTDDDVYMKHEFIDIARQYSKFLANQPVYKNHLNALFDMFRAYIAAIIPKEYAFEQGRALMFIRHALNLPIVDMQCKKQKLIIGFDENRPIYRNISCVLPTPRFLGTTLQFYEGKQMDKETAITWGMTGFEHPIQTIRPHIIRENEDMVPSLWLHASFYSTMDFTTEPTSWKIFLKQANQKRDYVLPDVGVRVECDGYGDIESLELKEWVVYDNYNEKDQLFLIGLVTFKNKAQDVVLVNVSSEDVHCHSGYTAIVNDHDPILSVVLEAYVGLIQKSESTTATERAKKPTASHTETGLRRGKSFIYLPRKSNKSNSKTVQIDIDSNASYKTAHFVMGHLRRIEGKASTDAIENAKRYGFVLPPGYTFVRPYKTGDTAEKTYAKLRK